MANQFIVRNFLFYDAFGKKLKIIVRAKQRFKNLLGLSTA